MLLDWVIYSAETVTRYYGRFPVDAVHINLQVAGGNAVRFGQAFGGESPVVRVVIGENVNTEALRRDWNGFYHRMPQGLPQRGDRGLDKTPTWGRTYWGGAMFCLLADVEIRRLTDNRSSLRDALRGVLEDGYSMQANATPLQIFESGDRATGVSVLVPMYQRMKADPYPVDLDQLWRDLGVAFENDEIVYDDSAPLAHIRKALLKS